MHAAVWQQSHVFQQNQQHRALVSNRKREELVGLISSYQRQEDLEIFILKEMKRVQKKSYPEQIFMTKSLLKPGKLTQLQA